MQVQEKGLAWTERKTDGIWHAQGAGGQYQLVPRRTGGFHAWFLNASGPHSDLGKHATLGGAMGAAARFDPATGQMAAEGPAHAADRYDTPEERVAKVRYYVEREGYGMTGWPLPIGDGNWRVAVTLPEGGKTTIVVSNADVESAWRAREGASEECSCAHTHPAGVPTKPCPQHGPSHAAENAVPVLYEARESAPGKTRPLQWHRTKAGGYTSHGRLGGYIVEQRKADRRHGVKPVCLLADHSRALYQFDSVSEAKAFAQAYDAGTVRAAAAATPPAPPAAEPKGKEAPRPKGAEGSGKTVSRWIHWSVTDLGRAYTGKGQVTGSAYRVELAPLKAITPRTLRRPHPEWILLTGSAALGQRFYDAEQAMLYADRIEAQAGGIPYSAEEPKDDPAVLAAVKARAASSNIGMAFIPDVMRDVMRDRRMGPGAVRGSLARLSESGQIELRPEGGLGRLTPEEKSLTMQNASGVVLSWARVIEAAHAAETPAAATPLVTLKRDFKTYMKCTKEGGVIDGPKDIWRLLGKQMNEEVQEVFVVVGLNIHDKLSDCPIEIARGARSRVEVDPSLVLQAAIASNADTFLVLHNHPGDRPDPSEADIALTKTIERAAKAIDSVKFREHYIVSGKGIYAVRARKMTRMR